jgi:hypothetical protein
MSIEQKVIDLLSNIRGECKIIHSFSGIQIYCPEMKDKKEFSLAPCLDGIDYWVVFDRYTMVGHIHWTHLKPIVEANQNVCFVLIHFSRRYSKEYIKDFFKDYDNIYAFC